MRAALICGLAVVAGAARAQVTYDAFVSGGGSTTLRYPLTVGTGTNRALAVFVHIGGDCVLTEPAVASVTYAGVPLVQILTRSTPSCTGSDSELWALPAGTQPASGTNDVVVSLTGPMTKQAGFQSGAIAAFGVDQTTTFTSVVANNGSSTTATATLPSSGANDLVFDSVCAGSPVTSTPQAARWLRNHGTGYSCDCSGGATAAGGTTSLSWAVTSDVWIVIGGSFKAAPAQTATFDNSAYVGGEQKSFRMTIGPGSNRAVAVFTHVGTPCNLGPTVSSISFASTPLVRILQQPQSAICAGGTSDLWSFPSGVEPPTGTSEVLIQLSSPIPDSQSFLAGAISAAGVDQLSPFTSVVGAAGRGTLATATAPDSGPGDLVIDSVCSGWVVTSTVETEVWKTNHNANTSCNNTGGATADAGRSTLSWVVGNDQWVLLAASFRAATPDAGQDGGVQPPLSLDVTCGCSGASGSLTLMALVAASVVRRRRNHSRALRWALETDGWH